MLGLRDPETRAAFEVIAKYIVIGVAGVWTLWAGTALIDKQRKALELENAALSIDSVPVADTQIEFPQNIVPPQTGVHCYPSGTYRIINTGKLPITIQPAQLQIFEIPDVYPTKGEKVISSSLEKVLEDLKPIWEESLGPAETIGVKNKYERRFSYVIERKEKHYYVLAANAQGALPKGVRDDDGVSVKGEFGENDLRHHAYLSSFCPYLDLSK